MNTARMTLASSRWGARAAAAASVVLAVGALVAGPASASTTVGGIFDPLATCNPGFTYVQTPDPVGTSYAVGAPGVITTWKFQATPVSVPQIKFKVFRPAGVGSFTVIHSTDVVAPTPGTINSYPVRLPVQAGDRLGLTVVTVGKCGLNGAVAFVAGDAPAGSTLAYGSMATGNLDVAAVVEPDADGDGYGDETQDLCPTQTVSHGACDLDRPDTTITKGPPSTTRTSVRFVFSSDEAGGTFECRLKGKNVRSPQLQEYRPCSSPKKYKHLRVGGYMFQARAIDAAGNRDLTPDHWKFRIKAS